MNDRKKHYKGQGSIDADRFYSIIKYFGKKNYSTGNKNIFISGMTNTENQTIKWELTKL